VVYINQQEKDKGNFIVDTGGIFMELRTLKVKLTERDKLTLLKYLDVCTELNGNGCNIAALKQENRKRILN
jgi:hypothetical protein